MRRRQFIQLLAKAGGLGAAACLHHPLLAQSPFAGKLLMTLQLDGGIDVTSLCDPKMNVPGEREINWWARTDETRQAGNVPYAPFAANQQFFEKYHRDLLVINGVDAQTNSHSVGVLHNWSGRNSEGFPSITALYAAQSAADLPMAYLNFGGFASTQNVIRSTRFERVDQLQSIIFPNQGEWEGSYLAESEWERVQRYQLANTQNLADESDVIAGNRANRRYYLEAFQRAEGIKEFGNMLPASDQLQEERELSDNLWSSLHQQIQVGLTAFRAGVSVSADLYQDGFDTHEDNDRDQALLMANTTDALDYLWTEAEAQGLADRIVLLIGTDFGRTPHYNSGQGKDHWPIGSFMVMERNASYTNRVMGETDEGHNAYPVNLATGRRDSINGVIIKPAHVHLALRHYLGISETETSRRFPFNNTDSFAFFS